MAASALLPYRKPIPSSQLFVRGRPLMLTNENELLRLFIFYDKNVVPVCLATAHTHIYCARGNRLAHLITVN